VIASNAGALAEPIKSFQSGQVVEPGDTKELMNAIKRIAQDYHKMS
jgi:glycosyltransferase involved in cell wall biosynthesis